MPAANNTPAIIRANSGARARKPRAMDRLRVSSCMGKFGCYLLTLVAGYKKTHVQNYKTRTRQINYALKSFKNPISLLAFPRMRFNSSGEFDAAFGFKGLPRHSKPTPYAVTVRPSPQLPVR